MTSSQPEELYQGVKFKTIFIRQNAPTHDKLKELKRWCRIFHEKNLAPPYAGGSFGNLSFRTENGTFIITGSRIGLKNHLADDCFVEVIDCNFQTATISIIGTRQPSSEAMLHAAIYERLPAVQAIFHGHCPELLQKAAELQLPVTKEEKPYGTIGLVKSVLEIIDRNNLLIMKNHGFIVVGKNMREAGELVLKNLEKVIDLP